MDRSFWLKYSDILPGAIVAYSSAVPSALVPVLLHGKKLESVRKKYRRGDRISNFMGAFHSLVVPVVYPVWINGSHFFSEGRHQMRPLCAGEPPAIALSALVQPDFEFKSVMFELLSLDASKPIVGKQLPDDWTPPTASQISPATELQLKRHYVNLFAEDRCLPAADKLTLTDWRSGKYIKVNDSVLSLEMLTRTIREQLRCEMEALRSAVLSSYGLKLVYTWEPPAIFAREIDPDLLDTLWVDALTSPGILPVEVIAIVFNDYRNKTVIPRLRERLPIPVYAKTDPAPALHGKTRVLHSNSDAFGAHILTQPEDTSLDGAIGANSSASASLFVKPPRKVFSVPMQEHARD